MFSLGWQETAAIFIIALLLFGPKKLPELGKNVAKALGEFRRASSELKYTWDQQMRELERETQEVKEASAQIESEIHSYTYDSSYSYDESDPYHAAYGSMDGSHTASLKGAHEGSHEGASIASSDMPSSSHTNESASAVEGADSSLSPVTSGEHSTEAHAAAHKGEA